MNERKYKFVVSFPHLGNYYVAIYNWLSNIFDKSTTKILIPKKMSTRTLEIGCNYSPDYICLPFKYNLGNFIESLDCGANVLIQAGGGCKYGYYAELQEKILDDLHYNFTFITLVEKGKIKGVSRLVCKFLKIFYIICYYTVLKIYNLYKLIISKSNLLNQSYWQ